MLLNTRRTCVGVTVAALVAVGFVTLPPASSAPSVSTAKPDKPGRQEVPLGPGKLKEVDGSHGKKYESDVIGTDTFDVAGITWDGSGDADLEFSVRTRSDGQWSEWVELHGDDHAPDPGTKEAKKARAGTDPLIAPNADAVELTVQTDESLPEDLQLEFVNSTVTEEDEDAATTTMWTMAEDIATTASAGLRPSIRTRKDWGADESIREPGNPDYGEIRGGFVHHTVHTNSYTREQVPGLIRSIYRYHVNGRGWRDIGYNFLIDRFGRTWEGRYGGMNRPVQGAHVSGYNSYSVGVSAMGTFTSNAPSSSLLGAYKRLFAWKFTLHGVNPNVKVPYPGKKQLPTIAGHRNGGSTECPGDRLYAKLGEIRRGTENLVQAGVPLVGGGDADNDGTVDMHTRRYNGTMWFHNSTGSGDFEPRQQIGLVADWNRFTAFVARDFNGDGNQDLITRRNDGAMLFRKGQGGGGFGAATEFGFSTNWNNFTGFIAGDYNDDGMQDLLTRKRDGTMWLRRGMDTGKFRGPSQIDTSTAWASYTAFVGAGDFDSDGHDDLIARHKNGNLYFLGGTGSGTLRSREEIGTGTRWNYYVGLVDIGDFSNDARPDVLARDNQGRLWVHPGNGVGTFQPRERVGTANNWLQYG